MAVPFLISISPSRKFFELCLWKHLDINQRQKSISYPRLKRGAVKYIRDEAKRLLVGPTHCLFLQVLKQKIYPKTLSLRWKTILPGSLEIMYDPQIREFVEILSLLGSTPLEISQELRSLPYVKRFTEKEIEGYCYFFWNNYEKDGWSVDKTIALQNLLNQSAISTDYAKHLRLGFGDTARLRVAIELGLDCTPDVILDEAYRGFCQGILKKNEALKMNDSESADTWSKILVRDTHILKNMGWQPHSTELSEKIKVTQETPDFLKSVT